MAVLVAELDFEPFFEPGLDPPPEAGLVPAADLGFTPPVAEPGLEFGMVAATHSDSPHSLTHSRRPGTYYRRYKCTRSRSL